MLDKQGKAVVRRGRYTVLRNGMHYLKDGGWVESQEIVEAVPGGAVARQGPHQVIFNNILSTNGMSTVDLPRVPTANYMSG